MNANEAIDKIVKLLGLKFQKENFFVTVLDDGATEVTNNMEGELQVGQTLYVVGETTLTPAPTGTHTTREGLVLTVDEESTITKVEVTTAEAEVEVEENEVEVETKKEEMETDFATQIEQLKSGITQLLEVMNSMNGKFKTEINSLKEEFNNLKNAPERKPIEKKANFKESFDDFRLDFIKELRG